MDMSDQNRMSGDGDTDELQSGYPCSWFVNVQTVKDMDLVCSVCTDVVRQATNTKCDHVFCLSCISVALASNPQCPVCRTALGPEHLSKNGHADRLVRKQLVRCFNAVSAAHEAESKASDACSWTGSLSDMTEHAGRCGFVTVACQGCGVSMLRRDLRTHQRRECMHSNIPCPAGCDVHLKRTELAAHKETCTKRLVPCPNGCGADDVTRGALEHHLEHVCPLQEVACVYARAGCLERMIRKNMPAHIEANSSHHLVSAMTVIDDMNSRLQNMSQQHQASLLAASKFVTISDGALVTAARDGSVLAVSVLLGMKADVNEQGGDVGGTALAWASAMGHRETMEMLLAAGADMEIGNNTGCTPIGIAASYGRLKAVELLLERKAAIEPAEHLQKPLLVAASNGRAAIAQRLLEAKANIDVRNSRGGTALMEASRNGHIGTVRTLLAAGADVNAVTEDGITALMVAAFGAREEIIEMLVARGADKRLKSKASKSAWDYAAAHIESRAAKGSKELAERLKKLLRS